MEIKLLTPSDIPAAAAVEQTCLQTAWTASQLATLPPEAVYLVAREDGAVCGIGSLYCVAGEAEVQNLAVLPAYRRRGMAQALLDTMREKARERGCDVLFLEVAAHNEPAIALYTKNGFVPVGRRKGFYRGEDALILKREEKQDKLC